MRNATIRQGYLTASTGEGRGWGEIETRRRAACEIEQRRPQASRPPTPLNSIEPIVCANGAWNRWFASFPRGVVGAPCPIETERRERRATPFEEPPLHGLASLALLTWTGGWLRCPKIEVRPKRVLFLHYSLFKRKKNLAPLTWANCWEMDLIDAPTFGKCLNSIRSIFFLFSYWCLLARAIPAYFYGLFLRHCVASVSRYLIKSHYLSMKKEIVLSKCSLNNSLVHAFEKRYQLQKKNA